MNELYVIYSGKQPLSDIAKKFITSIQQVMKQMK